MTQHQMLRCRAEAARHSRVAHALPEPVTKQPEGIKGTMREYQIEGLSFMVARFDEGIHPILAGAPVLCQCDVRAASSHACAANQGMASN